MNSTPEVSYAELGPMDQHNTELLANAHPPDWTNPTPEQIVSIEFGDYEIRLPPEGIEVNVGEYVEFVATSDDVTYGFGVFRPDSSMVFQMQVPPGRENTIIWKFDAPGTYDVRSTEYSGPRHSEMYVQAAIRVTQ